MQNQNVITNVITQNKNRLARALDENNCLLQSIPVENQQEFRENFLELASNDYLVSAIDLEEIIRFAVNITKLGLNVNPAYKEVYIVPFYTKVRDRKVMLPQAIIPLNGLQEMAYRNGLFLRLYGVYKIGSEIVSEKEMKRHHQVELKTSDAQWVDDHFVGFDVVLEDLRGEMPPQIQFVEVGYLRKVTKTIKDASFKTQTWRHKAVRRAFDNFLVPRNRQVDVFTKVDHINNAVLENSGGDIDVKPETLEQLGLKVIQSDGLLIVQGNTYGKVEHLKQLGFRYENGSWVRPEEPVDTTVVEPDEVNPPVNNISYARTLFGYLVNKGLNKAQISIFVRDVLGLTSSNEEGIAKALSDEELLSQKVNSFIGNGFAANPPRKTA